MNKKLYAGISQILLGALVAIAPQTFAHVCAVKETPMACHYTAQAALGIGIVIAVLGVAGLFVSDQTRAGLDIANAVLGVLTITVPTVLIGVCKGAMMHCHMVTLPTLIVLVCCWPCSRQSPRILISSRQSAPDLTMANHITLAGLPLVNLKRKPFRTAALTSSSPCLPWPFMEARCCP